MYTNSKLGIKVLIFWLGMVSFIFSLGFFIASRFSYSNRNAMHSCEKLISTVSNVGDVYYDIDYNSPSYDSDGNEISSESWDVFYYFDFEISWLYGDNALNESVKRQVGHDTFSHKPRQYDLDCDYYKSKIKINVGDEYKIYVKGDGSFYNFASSVEESASKYEDRKHMMTIFLIIGIVLIVISGVLHLVSEVRR